MIFVNRLEILLRRLRASWMDAMSAPNLNQEFYDNLADHNRIGNDRACAVHTHSITEWSIETYWTTRIYERQDTLDKWFKIAKLNI